MDPQNTSKDSTISVKNFVTDILMAFDYIFTMIFIRIFNFIDDYLIFELILISSQLTDSWIQFRDILLKSWSKENALNKITLLETNIKY